MSLQKMTNIGKKKAEIIKRVSRSLEFSGYSTFDAAIEAVPLDRNTEAQLINGKYVNEYEFDGNTLILTLDNGLFLIVTCGDGRVGSRQVIYAQILLPQPN